MTKKPYRLLGLIVCLAFCQTLWATLSISPVKFELLIAPGKSFTDVIHVRNVTDEEIEVQVYFSDFNLNEENALQFLDEGSLKHSLAPWIRIQPTALKIAAQEEKLVRFTVEMPENSDGDLQAMIFFQSVPKGAVLKEGARQVLISTRIGAVIYACPKGREQKLGDIPNLYLRENQPEGGLEYALLFANKGNIHLRPAGKIKLLNEQGKTLISLPFNEQQNPVLREGCRIFEGKIGSLLKPGKYLVRVEMDYGGSQDLQVEKPYLLQADKGIAAVNLRREKSQPKVLLVALLRGIPDKGELAGCAFIVRDLTGKILARIPAALKSGGPVPELTAEWSPLPPAGIYMVELVQEQTGQSQFNSFAKMIIKE